MLLKSLEIQGFKTFAERTRLEFSSGITCLVGPNGSGKSNIADAILWALGESNVRELRGSQNQDVIFAGNGRRRPSGMAEVLLTVDNQAGSLPLQWSEITVARRLYRSSEAEFAINNVRCRLRDIYELFLDTGVGRDAYSLIGQGQIDEILSVRADERRSFFEEAAGVKKYRIRRRETERRLGATSQNLLRVGDIIDEVEAQIAPLERQARAAQRYEQVAADLSRIGDAYYGSTAHRLAASLQELRSLVEQLADERAVLAASAQDALDQEASSRESAALAEAEESRARADLESCRSELEELRIERVRQAERTAESDRRLKQLDQTLSDLAERLTDQERRSADAVKSEEAARAAAKAAEQAAHEAAQDLEKAAVQENAAAEKAGWLREDWRRRERAQSAREAAAERLRARRDALEQALERGARRVDQLRAGCTEVEHRAGEIETELKSLDEKLPRLESAVREADAAVRTAREALNAARAARSAAERHLHELRAARHGLEKTLSRLEPVQGAGQHSLLSSELHCPPGETARLGALLFGLVPARFVESEQEALETAEAAAAAGETAALLPGLPSGAPASLPGLDVWGSDRALAWLAALRGGYLPAESLSQALADRRAALESGTLRPDALWVTPAGCWVNAAGLIGAGSPGTEDAAASIRLRAELAACDEALPGAEAAAAKAREAEAAAEREAKAAEEAAGRAHSARDRTKHEATAARRSHDGSLREAAAARARLTQAQEELAHDTEALQALTGEEEQVPPQSDADPDPNEDELKAAESELRSAAARRRELESAAAAARVRMAECRQRLNSAEETRRRSAEGWNYLSRQQADRIREKSELLASAKQQHLQFETVEERQAAATARRDAADAAVAAALERRRAEASAAEEARKKREDLAARQAEIDERRHRAEVELLAVKTELAEAVRAWSDLRAGGLEETDEPLKLPALEELSAGWDAGQAAAVLSGFSDPAAAVLRLRRQLRAMGPINADAPEQLRAVSERREHLLSQQGDLLEARRQLEQAIEELDQLSRDAFITTFTRIAEAFDLMFKRLFGGGATELKLTNPDNVLESGVDILVQVPGKRVQNLLLLSGGERAFTAVAMLFALLTVKPSPFCVLDEVDAALDEANVRRFSEVLRDFARHTQFIVVTHNRITMEGADRLYGVTMEERGISRVLGCTLQESAVSEAGAGA